MGQKYGLFNKDWTPRAFYDEEIHGKRYIKDENGNLIKNPECKIPAEAIPIPDEEWQKFINNQGKMKWDPVLKKAVSYESPPPSLDELKQQKKAEIKRVFEEELRKGYLTSLGFRVDCKLEDLNNFDVALKLAEMAGMTEITIRDYDNITRTLTFDEYKQMCLELGQYIQELFKKKWTLQAQVDKATTKEELAALTW